MTGERSERPSIDSVLEQITDGFVAYDEQWRFTYVNHRVEHYLQRRREELLGKNVWDEFPSTVGTLYYQELHRAVAEQLATEFTMLSGAPCRWHRVLAYPSARGVCVYFRDITDQRSAEKKLLESDPRYRMLFENSVDGVFLGTPEGAIDAVNAAGCAVLGYTEAELCHIGLQGIADMTDPSWGRALAERERTKRNTAVLSFVRRDGSTFPAEVSSAIFSDERGNRRACTIVRDLTSARHTQRRLGYQEARFRRLVEASPEGIWTTDENGKTDYVNHRIAEMLGYPREELQARPLPGLMIDEEERARIGYLIQPRGDVEWVDVRDSRLQRSDGSDLWVMMTTAPLASDTGEFLGTLTTIADITDRKHAEDSLRFLGEASRELVRHLDDDERLENLVRLLVPRLADICVVDLLEGGEFRRVAVAHAEGVSPASAAVITQAKVSQVLRTGRAELLPEGDFEATSMMLVPLMLEGRPVGVLSFAFMQPCRRYGQADLELAGSIADWASLAIDHGQLYRKALQASQARDEVLRIVSHDLRDPLHNIGLAVQLILMNAEGPRTKQHLARIQRSVATAHRLIEDLLDLARLDVGKLILDRQRHDSAGIVTEAIERQRACIEHKALQVRVAVEPDLPPISADRHRLLQVFANLLGNAIKYASGGGWIRIEAVHKGGLVRFSVEDNGPGISKESLPHVFDRFWQAKGQQRAGAGLGLGLAIAKAIVEVHGGAIWVESNDGKGTAFRFTCPASA